MKLIIIGSSQNANMRFNSPYVSAYHAELLILDNGDILLTDKASKNGTFVNNTRIEPNKEISVKIGDVVRFADQSLDWNEVPRPDNMADVKEIRGVGTNFNNRYQLRGSKVSRFHATFKLKKDKKWYIQDHSKNGTTVNGISIPPNQDIRIKKSDSIVCGGVECPNPYSGKVSSSGLPWKWIIGGAVIAAIVACLFLFLPSDWKKSLHLTLQPKQLSDSQIYAKYKSSIVLMVGYYYYEVSAGNYNLEKLGLPTHVILDSRGNIIPISDSDLDKMYSYTGTGFFVSKDGKIITNLHLVRPWLFNKDASKISDIYKQELAGMGSMVPQLNAVMDQIKVEGVVHIGYIPNGEYFSVENIKTCREVTVSENIDADVALLQSVTKKLPSDTTAYVPVSDFVTSNNDIKVGEHIYTMGFPFGINTQDLQSTNGIQLLARGGNITQECNQYSFGFDATSYSGASGSPTFNDRGQLVGIQNAGIEQKEGFNYGIKAVYAKELIDKFTSH